MWENFPADTSNTYRVFAHLVRWFPTEIVKHLIDHSIILLDPFICEVNEGYFWTQLTHIPKYDGSTLLCRVSNLLTFLLMMFIYYKLIQNKLIGNIAKFQKLSYNPNPKNCQPNPSNPKTHPYKSLPPPSLNSLTKQNKIKYFIVLNILGFYMFTYLYVYRGFFFTFFLVFVLGFMWVLCCSRWSFIVFVLWWVGFSDTFCFKSFFSFINVK